MSLFIHFFTFPFHRSYVFPAYFAPGPMAEWKSEGGLGPPRSDANLPRFLSFFRTLPQLSHRFQSRFVLHGKRLEQAYTYQ